MSQDVQNSEQLYLLKEGKKGLLRIVFSRAGTMIVLIVLQVALFLSFYNWFSEYFRWFSAAQAIFSIGMVFYLFNCDMDATAKLTWLNLIMLFPVPATIMLWFTQHEVGHRSVKGLLAKRISESRDFLAQDADILSEPDIVNSGTDDLNRYMNRTNRFPIYRNTETTYFPLGEDMFEAMLGELKNAEKYIYMEYFIIEEGKMWGSILKILAEKAKQGVDVRVMYDGMCEISLLTSDYPKQMQQLGIKCKAFSPVMPFVSTHYNYRDHRKILVVDGKVAFNGGVNLADEYINHVQKFGHWKDTAVMLKGDAAASFELMFLQMWNITEKNPDWGSCGTFGKKAGKAGRAAGKKAGSGYVIPYCDCPLDEDKVGEMVYIDILNRAKSYVHIMTPYLILDNELEMALKFAAARGVDVTMILPGVPDKKPVYALAKSHYKSLVGAGVKIYEYTPGFVHAKVFVSDDEKGVVGTINLDYRSLYHHFECATYLYKAPCIADIEKDFQATLAKCRPVTEESIKHERVSYKVTGKLLKIFAPLM